MPKFQFTGKRVIEQNGVIIVEAGTLKEALDKIHWGAVKFDLTNSNNRREFYDNISLYMVDDNMSKNGEKY